MDELETRIVGWQNFFPLTEKNVDVFLEEVASVTETGDRRAVRPVLLLADERCPLGGVMDRMLSLLEDVPLKDYVEELLEALPEFNAKSPLYSEQEVKKLLWSDQDRAVFVAASRGLGSEKAAALRAVLGRVNSPRLTSAVGEIERVLG